jgi:hypothetical protein
VQLRPRQMVTFKAVHAEKAVEAARTHHGVHMRYLTALSEPQER